jgi:hypothetical protein
MEICAVNNWRCSSTSADAPCVASVLRNRRRRIGRAQAVLRRPQIHSFRGMISLRNVRKHSVFSDESGSYRLLVPLSSGQSACPPGETRQGQISNRNRICRGNAGKPHGPGRMRFGKFCKSLAVAPKSPGACAVRTAFRYVRSESIGVVSAPAQSVIFRDPNCHIETNFQMCREC